MHTPRKFPQRLTHRGADISQKDFSFVKQFSLTDHHLSYLRFRLFNDWPITDWVIGDDPQTKASTRYTILKWARTMSGFLHYLLRTMTARCFTKARRLLKARTWILQKAYQKRESTLFF